MRSKTAYNHQVRLITILCDIWSTTIIFHRCHRDHIEAMTRLWDDEGLKRCPGHVKSYINGYARALWDHHSRCNVVWRLPYNGVLYKGWSDLPEEGKELYLNKTAVGKLVYKDNEDFDW